MTTNELRDRLAELIGYRKIEPQHPLGKVMWECGGVIWCDCLNADALHPFPLGDLTALAAAFPEGWKWGRCNCTSTRDTGEWYAYNGGGQRLAIDDTGDEYDDRLRLTVAVREAMKEKT